MDNCSPYSEPAPATEYFTGLASLYADHRPTYPAEAIDWILDGLAKPVAVADIGCGTGISTRLLAEHGASVIGIDPNADMLDLARQLSSSRFPIEYRSGVGEHTGLEDRSFDLIVCAQSFHWFDPLAALREFHRILRPGGRLALMWNMKTADNAFSAEFTRMAQDAQRDAETRGLHVPSEREADPTLGGFFTNVRRRQFANPQSLDLNGVLGRARSASYFPRSGLVREQFESELQRSFDRRQTNGRVVLTHDTEVTLADRV